MLARWLKSHNTTSCARFEILRLGDLEEDYFSSFCINATKSLHALQQRSAEAQYLYRGPETVTYRAYNIRRNPSPKEFHNLLWAIRKDAGILVICWGLNPLPLIDDPCLFMILHEDGIFASRAENNNTTLQDTSCIPGTRIAYYKCIWFQYQAMQDRMPNVIPRGE